MADKDKKGGKSDDTKLKDVGGLGASTESRIQSGERHTLGQQFGQAVEAGTKEARAAASFSVIHSDQLLENAVMQDSPAWKKTLDGRPFNSAYVDARGAVTWLDKAPETLEDRVSEFVRDHGGLVLVSGGQPASRELQAYVKANGGKILGVGGEAIPEDIREYIRENGGLMLKSEDKKLKGGLSDRGIENLEARGGIVEVVRPNPDPITPQMRAAIEREGGTILMQDGIATPAGESYLHKHDRSLAQAIEARGQVAAATVEQPRRDR